MIIYQAQPNRVFPTLMPFHKKNINPVCYEFSTQFKFTNENDLKYMSENKFIYYNSDSSLPRSIDDANFNPISIRFKSYHDRPNINENNTIDYAFGLFSSNFINKKDGDISFTIIDHPINQLLNIFYYVKYNILSEEEIKESEDLLKKYDEDLKKELNKNKIDLDEFYIEDLHPEALDFRITKDFFLKYKEEKENMSPDEAKDNFRDYYSKYYIYMLICATSLKNMSSMEEWVDYFLANPKLQDLINYKDMRFTYSDSFIHCSELYPNHDFYGIMDSRKSIIKTLNIISNKNDTIFFDLHPSFNYHNPMESFLYKRKELEAALEKDIAFFEEKKKIFNEYKW